MHQAFVGLISGTSADGIDAALVRFEPALEVLHFATLAYPDDLSARLKEIGQQATLNNLDEFGALDHAVGECFAEAAMGVLQVATAHGIEVRAIGSHGQTLRHAPQGRHPFTLQIGDPNLIAERTGCTTVADFRRRDMAAGGQGAPLLPALHEACFGHAAESRAVLNLGGIANLTLLGGQRATIGFDTGPANGLMDAWCAHCTGQPFDDRGAWARTGRPVPGLVQAWLADPWFARPPPKSSGRDQFHLGWVADRAGGLEHHQPEDVQASLLQLTARTVAGALNDQSPHARRLIVCGGGVRNLALMDALREALPQCAVESSAAHGLDPDAVEAVGFAWLARQTLRGEAGNLPTVTGARGARVLGAVYHA